MRRPATTSLRVLRDKIQQRTQAMNETHGPWPCHAGCDACCHRLGAPPMLTAVEADAVWKAYRALPANTRAEARARVESLRPDAQGHYTCPLLDADRGRCLVYDARPLACRTYGFYAGRDGDYWCEQVDAHLEPRRRTLTCGNQIAMDQDRDAMLGPSTDLVTIFAARHREDPDP